MQKFQLVSLFLFLFMFTVINKACAYIDPGTGSYILQLLVAGFVGSIVAIKIYWSKIKIYLSSIFGKKTPKEGS